MELTTTTIYMNGQSTFTYKGVLYTFTDENQARTMNEAIAKFKVNGIWPEHYVCISNLASPREIQKVSVAELAEVIWNGFRLSLETIFVTCGAIALMLCLIVIVSIPYM